MYVAIFMGQGGWLFSMGPGFTWADAEYTRTFFGVSSQQSAASGLPASCRVFSVVN